MMAALPDMLLTCTGAASYTDATFAFGNASGSNGSSVSANSTSLGRANSSATADFEVVDGAARLRPPKVIIPSLSTGRKNGWWEVVGLSSDQSRITGQIKFGLIARGKFDIDRRTGAMRIIALGESFEGSCVKASTETKF